MNLQQNLLGNQHVQIYNVRVAALQQKENAKTIQKGVGCQHTNLEPCWFGVQGSMDLDAPVDETMKHLLDARAEHALLQL